jgi:hypothetical protein
MADNFFGGGKVQSIRRHLRKKATITVGGLHRAAPVPAAAVAHAGTGENAVESPASSRLPPDMRARSREASLKRSERDDERSEYGVRALLARSCYSHGLNPKVFSTTPPSWLTGSGGTGKTLLLLSRISCKPSAYPQRRSRCPVELLLGWLGDKDLSLRWI